MKAGDRLYPLLGPLVDGRIYPMIATESADQTRPYIIWQIISSIPEVTDDGVTGHEWVRVQIDIYHDDYDECTDLAHKVIGSISDNIHPSEYENSQQSYETESKLFRQSLDVEFWQTTPFT
ncbi:tail completion protein gp17 [Psychrobacter sp. MES7-P7E]|uniref:tail completion protein gp17 n=1 Tax=Psychrobacter sp. MES7-P7E TaxID=2058322 RepID=UPI000C7EC79A|nr:DUF3168 domain-containing protein [Psychrobacter sp. MES7-P7E]PLT21283.1 hypothetical protein CXF62_10940 [Psychrobacter sp. MES7-P7E]